MSISSKRSLEIHVCYGYEHLGEYPHWLLSLQSPGASECTWLHSTGGPSQGRAYECSIRANKHIESVGIASSSIQGYISPKDVSKVIGAVRRIEPQQCQMYVITVAAELEKTGLLSQCRTAFLFKTRFKCHKIQQTIANDPLSLSRQSHTPRRTVKSSMVTGDQI